MNDDQILTDFISKYGAKLIGFARSAAYNDHEDARDAWQDLFAKRKASAQLLPFLRADDTKGALDWCYFRLGFVVRDIRKKRLKIVDKQPTMFYSPPEGILAHEAADLQRLGHGHPPTERDTDAMAKSIAMCLNTLGSTMRTVIELCVLGNPPATNEEAAVALGTDKGTIKARKSEALSKLRKCLQAKGFKQSNDF